jgi:hypothetical protein
MGCLFYWAAHVVFTWRVVWSGRRSIDNLLGSTSVETNASGSAGSIVPSGFD